MLISPMPPGLARFSDAGAFCPTGDGLSGDPFGITDVVGIVSNFINARKQEKIQKQQIGVEQATLKQQKVVDAQNFAAQQAVILAAPSEHKRQDQMLALFAVGGAAVLVAGLFIYGAVKKG